MTMIGRLDETKKSVTIVGAGISGLLIGYHLKKLGYRVRILEKSNRAGGLIDTLSTQWGPVETAAHSLMVTPEIEEFMKEIGVELAPVHPRSTARYIYRRGKMRKFPLTWIETLVTLVRFFSKPRPIPKIGQASLAEWCLAYLGKPALQFLLAPFVTGVFATRPENLNLSISFPRLVPKDPSRSLFSELLSRRGGPKTSRPRMMAPLHGMKDLTVKLRAKLSEEIELLKPMDSMPIEPVTGEVPNWIFTVPAPELAELISPIDPESARALRAIEYSPLITCTVFIRGDSFTRNPPQGVGVLIPRGEGLRILGVLFNSSAFPNRTSSPDLHSFTVMLGGTEDPDGLNLTDPELTDLIGRELSHLFGLRSAPEGLHITRWKRAIPVYSSVLQECQERLARGVCAASGRVVFSNFSKEVSIRGLIQSLHTHESLMKVI